MLTQLFSGQNRGRILGWTGVAVVAGAIAAIGCGGATGGLPSGVSGALNNVKLSTSVITLSSAGAGATEVRPGTIASIGTRYLKVTLKGAGYDGQDISYFYNTTPFESGAAADFELENNKSGFGKKEEVYYQDIPSAITAKLRPLTLGIVDGKGRYLETASYSFRANGKSISVKPGDVRKAFDAAGNYTDTPLDATDASIKKISAGVHLTSLASAILNHDKFDVVFDFIDFDGAIDGASGKYKNPDAGVVGAIGELMKQEGGKPFEETLPNGTKAYRVYRVLLPVQGQATTESLSLTAGQNTAVDDPTLGYSGLMKVSLKVDQIPAEAKRLVVSAVEKAIQTGDPNSREVRVSYEFQKDLSSPAASENVEFFVVNRLRTLQFEVRGFALRSGQPGSDKELSATTLAAIPIAGNFNIAGPAPVLESDELTPVAGQPLAKLSKSLSLKSLIKSVTLKVIGSLLYQAAPSATAASNASDVESIEVETVATVGTVTSPTVSGGSYQGSTTEVKIPARLTTLKFFKAAVVQAGTPPKFQWKKPAEKANPVVSSDFLIAVDGSASTSPFSFVAQQKDKTEVLYQESGSSVRKAITMVEAELKDSLGAGSIPSTAVGIEARLFGSDLDSKARTSVTGLASTTPSATVTIEECSEAPGSSGCTATGIKFTGLKNNPGSSAAFDDIPVVGRGLGYQIRYQAWSELNGQGVKLAEKVVGVSGQASFVALSLDDLSKLAKTATAFAAVDSNLVSLRLEPSSLSTSRGSSVQFRPIVALKDPATEVPINPALVTFNAASNGAADPSVLHQTLGTYLIGNAGTGAKAFTVTASLPDLAAALAATSPVVTVSAAGVGAVQVRVSGFDAWPVGNARLTGPQQFTLRETISGDSRSNFAGPIYGFAGGLQSGFFNVTPLATYTYHGRYQRLAAPSGGSSDPVVLADSAEIGPVAGSAGLIIDSGIITSRVSGLRVGLLTGGTPGQVINPIGNLVTSATGKDSQILTLTPAVQVGANWVALDPSMCTYSVDGGFSDGHQIGGNTIVISNSPRSAAKTYTITATYYEVSGSSPTNRKAAQFTLTVPANRRDVGVIIK